MGCDCHIHVDLLYAHEIYRNCGDYRLKVQILHKLEERAFGPPRKEREGGKTPADINVNIRRIGSTP